MNFASVYDQGFVRVAACVPTVAIADPRTNAAAVAELLRACADEGVGVAVFPELALTGYSIEDLLLQETVLDEVEEAVADLVAASADLTTVLRRRRPAAARQPPAELRRRHPPRRGARGGARSRTCRPTASSTNVATSPRATTGAGARSRSPGQAVPLGPDLLFTATDVPGLTFHVEVCEDLWVPVPPSAEAALAGANLLLNLSGSPITVGRAEDRRLLVRSQSARCLAAYVYTAAGPGESSTDLSWDGQTMVYELGQLLAETDRFPDGPAPRGGRRRPPAAAPGAAAAGHLRRQPPHPGRRAPADFRTVTFALDPPREDLGLRRSLDRFPFVPDDADRLALDCYEAYNIQVTALDPAARRDRQPQDRHRRLGRSRLDPRADGRGQGDGPARPAAHRHPRLHAAGLRDERGDQGQRDPAVARARGDLRRDRHPARRRRRCSPTWTTRSPTGDPVYDVTFENVQAGLRTDYLFRLANQRDGIVLGTGDLSELALGWCTYGVGDQMSHYAVNAGIPKTLIQHLIRWAIGNGEFDAETNAVLSTILAQEISPELVPVAEGERPQSTEAKIGPYALQDFTLFHVLRYGFPPSRIAFLAAARLVRPRRRRLAARLRRRADGVRPADHPALARGLLPSGSSASSQFKRSAIPNGPKVVAGGALSPRGEWRAPSDGNARAWLAELERNVPA